MFFGLEITLIQWFSTSVKLSLNYSNTLFTFFTGHFTILPKKFHNTIVEKHCPQHLTASTSKHPAFVILKSNVETGL